MSDEEELVQYDFKAQRRFKRAPTEPKGKPANVEVTSGGKLKLLGVGDTQFKEQDDNEQAFVELLKSWGGEWMWNGLNLIEDPS